jgi:hypothetical protein
MTTVTDSPGHRLSASGFNVAAPARGSRSTDGRMPARAEVRKLSKNFKGGSPKSEAVPAWLGQQTIQDCAAESLPPAWRGITRPPGRGLESQPPGALAWVRCPESRRQATPSDAPVPSPVGPAISGRARLLPYRRPAPERTRSFVAGTGVAGPGRTKTKPPARDPRGSLTSSASAFARSVRRSAAPKSESTTRVPARNESSLSSKVRSMTAPSLTRCSVCRARSGRRSRAMDGGLRGLLDRDGPQPGRIRADSPASTARPVADTAARHGPALGDHHSLRVGSDRRLDASRRYLHRPGGFPLGQLQHRSGCSRQRDRRRAGHPRRRSSNRQQRSSGP